MSSTQAADSELLKAHTSAHVDDGGGEEMLRLVQGMFLSTKGSVHRQVVFCGVGGENGSSAVCASTARTLAANSSRPVCLVDADLRTPHLSRLLRVDATDAPAGKSGSVIERCVEINRNLWLAGVGFLAEDGRLPSADRLKELFAQLRGEFEFVLIDAPGGDVAGDAAILGQISDGTILVIDADSTRRISARKVKEIFDAAGVRLSGTVLHNRSFPIPRSLYERL